MRYGEIIAMCRNKNSRALIAVFSLLLLLGSCVSSKTPKQHPAGYDPPYVVSSIDEYLLSVSENPDMELVDLEQSLEGIVLDIRYATSNNFTGETIYTLPKAFLRKPVSDALRNVVQTLSLHNLGLKIYDAYRPYSATVKFYEVYPDTDFVADPRYGSRHNRGCAVDVTLIDLTTKQELLMPSDFDDFSEKAHPEYMDLPEEAIANRTLLFRVMQQHGFNHYPTEWWHFDFTGWDQYPLMDLSFEELMGITEGR